MLSQFDFKKIDFVKGYHYSDSQGYPTKKKILNFYEDSYNTSFSEETDILITAGSKIAIFISLIATVNKDDDVLIHEPAWLSYREQLKLVDANPKFIPYRTSIENFHKYITKKTSMIIINNPNNPAGKIYSKRELDALVDLCAKNNFRLLVDEAYSDFIQPGLFETAINCDKGLKNVIVANSLSKNMGMSGWRIGYLIANKKLINKAVSLNQHLITCAPTVLQLYIYKYFDQITNITLPQAREPLIKK